MATTRLVQTFVLALVMAAQASAARAADDSAPPPAAQSTGGDPAAGLAIAEKLAPSLVRVEYTLRYDNGEPPVAGGWSTRCPNCGQYHDNNAEQVVKDDRPFETAGFLLAPDKVLTADPVVHPRFVKSISVTLGDQTVSAAVDAYAKNQTALVLKLDKPLTAGKPLAFDAKRPGPYSAVTYRHANGVWTTSTQGVGGAASLATDGRRFVAVPSYSLIVDKDGTPVGAAMRDELTVGDDWKGSPLDWPLWSATDHAKLVAAAEQRAKNSLLRVTMNFRSPRASAGRDRFRMGDDDEADSATVRHATGVLLGDGKTLLVLSELKPNVTSRLERIRVQGPDGKSVAATFKHTLADYGALVATVDKAPAGAEPVAVASGDLFAYRGVLLPAALVQLQGDKRTEYFDHRRIASFETRWRRQLYPEIPGGIDRKPIFLFDPDGKLVALPIGKRDKANRERWSRDQDVMLTAATYVAAAAADPAKYADAANVPVSEAEENRLAWLGVELQALTPELAQANEVSHLTNNGQSGALVTHVYANSPAAKAGVEHGFVLLRLHVADQPKPIDVRVEPSAFGDQPFPWDQLDQLTEQYFDQVPQPWPSAESAVTRELTDLGFGKAFVAEFANGGKVIKKDLVVEQSPAHYDNAARFKADALGLTVRDMTYEVNRYFQRADGEPGVVISKIEIGSKASTAGIKPFELVTHVNDQPVKTAKEFEQAVKGQLTLRLSIKRMTKGRQVKIEVPAAGAPDAKKPTPPAAKADDDEK